MDNKNVLFNIYGTIIDSYVNEEQEIVWVTLANYFEMNRLFLTPGELNLKFRTIREQMLNKRYSDKCQFPNYRVEEIFSEIYTEANVKFTADDITNLCNIYREQSTKYIKLHNGVLKVLKYFKKKGYKLYGFDGGQRALANYDFTNLKINNLFDGLVFGSDIYLQKNESDFHKQVLNELSLTENTRLISNEIIDINQAKKLNIPSIFIITKQTGTVAHDEIPNDAIYDGNIKTLYKRL